MNGSDRDANPHAISCSLSSPTKRQAVASARTGWSTHRPDLFEGVDAAVGEVGGFSFTVRDDLRLYLIETAEKGIAWMRLTADGRAGHGSMVNRDNAVTKLADAVARLG